MLTVTRLFKAMLLSGCITIAGCACVPSSIDEELDKILADVGNQYAAIHVYPYGKSRPIRRPTDG